MNAEVVKRPPSDRYGATCPHCQSRARVRSSRTLTELIRSYIFACTNLECGATFGGQMEINYQISIPANPNPRVRLRTSPPRPRPANDHAANDLGG